MDYTISNEKLKVLIEANDGIVSGKQLNEAGIDRTKIYSLIREGVLAKESHGNYYLADNQPDEYIVIQKRSDKLIFSHATALYLHGMSDKVPHCIDITVPQGDNISRIKKSYQNTRFHYCKKDLWDLGIQTMKTPMGYTVKSYDIERCICDIIRDKDDIDVQVFTQAIREYFTGKTCNTRKIIKYSKVFNIEKKVRSYMEILQ